LYANQFEGHIMNKVRENRARRVARRRGLDLVKSRRRDPSAIGWQRYCLKDRWDVTRVVGVVQGVGFTIVDAPIQCGGMERFAAWVTLDTVERLLIEGLQ
jgi:hypothetical protein